MSPNPPVPTLGHQRGDFEEKKGMHSPGRCWEASANSMCHCCLGKWNVHSCPCVLNPQAAEDFTWAAPSFPSSPCVGDKSSVPFR